MKKHKLIGIILLSIISLIILVTALYITTLPSLKIGSKNFGKCLLIKPGVTKQEVIQVMGIPTGEYSQEKGGVFYYQNGFLSSDGFDIIFDENGIVKTAVCN